MTHVLLIDGNNLGYAATFVKSNQEMSHEGQPTGGIHGLLSSTVSLINTFPDAVPVVLWDGDPVWRHEMCPEYKAHRYENPEMRDVQDLWRIQRPYAQALLGSLGIWQVRDAYGEADDLAGALMRSTPDHRAPFGITRVTGVSQDHDWRQGVGPGSDLWSPAKKPFKPLPSWFTEDSFADDKDGPFRDAEQYMEAKIAAGDTSDGIAGIPGIGLKTAGQLLTKYGSWDQVILAVQEGRETSARARKVPEYGPTLERNRVMMNARYLPKDAPHAYGFWVEPYRVEPFRSLCDERGLVQQRDKIVSYARHGDTYAEGSQPHWFHQGKAGQQRRTELITRVGAWMQEMLTPRVSCDEAESEDQSRDLVCPA